MQSKNILSLSFKVISVCHLSKKDNSDKNGGKVVQEHLFLVIKQSQNF